MIEQVEEEATASNIIQQLKLIGDDGNGLFMLDRELGQRSGVAAEDEAMGLVCVATRFRLL